MNNAQLINQTSGNVEYYTDPKLIEAAREVMTGIDLDPASSAAANTIVKAVEFYDIQKDGLKQTWHGNVWMNHPFGIKESACVQPCKRKAKNPKHVCHSFDYHGNAAWINKLMSDFAAHEIRQCINITYAATSEAWFQPLLNGMNCFLCPRTNYYLPDGTIKKGVTKGSVITYFGENRLKFRSIFSQFGKVKL